MGQICAKFRPNCSFSVKSMKVSTETVFKMTKKIGYGGTPEVAVLPSYGCFFKMAAILNRK